jgi:hypothetical protein
MQNEESDPTSAFMSMPETTSVTDCGFWHAEILESVSA